MSPNFEIPVVLPAALHARPAGAVVRAAASFQSQIEVRVGERSASARSALRLMSLGADTGATVVVHAAGGDAAAAARAVAAALLSSE
ncbi:HPr family phosphocarrier protein [Actinoplanes hulinensis]|uniref:Phosphocarrier protein HPr n=1 Tax=Actinoplanes hulinensis TaxID=1144547 RepID=A0ABS7BGZ0_9ACTN|nr:HPr family phosphocarrier protein [Actinoplanes hulinensis]MBW6440173.1 HPr family phosphocarrier protein [Actinoplanes hulinensis]